MSEAIYDVMGGHVEAVSGAQDHVQQSETVLLCRNSLVSIGLKYLLEDTCFSITNSASDAAFFSLSCPDASPTLFIMDGSDASGHIIDTAKALKGQYPQARIAVIADCFDLGFVKLARSAGIDGFCLSANDREVLIKSLELVMLGEVVMPTSVMSLLLDLALVTTELKSQDKTEAGLEWSDPRLRKLSSRESQILHCLTDGAPNKVIARKLDVAEATVKVHVKAILRKIGAANRTQAAMWATTHLPTNVESSLRA
jgi:two-component system nitrate/nitrite response regulator NarL